MDFKWVSIKDKFPEDNQKVVVVTHGNNIQVAVFRRGRPIEVVKATGSIWPYDQYANNLVPYGWEADAGPMSWFGQDVSYWAELPALPDGAEEAYTIMKRECHQEYYGM